MRGPDGVPAVSSSLNLPTGLAVDANDDVFVVDWGNLLIRKLIFSGQPVIATNGLVSSVSSMPGPFANGSLLTILGMNLAPSAAEADAAAWPAELNGVSVRLNGEPIPLQFVSVGQINGRIPQSTAVGEASVVVTTPAGTSYPELLSITDPAAAIFFPASVRTAQVRALTPGGNVAVVSGQ
jgi:uncharacterized protein (TIGR03437 family)